ncbi:MAG: Era-like GTP-binding protein [Candidatus Hodarchaeales archaeon]|jgi:predicted GTPase
MNIIDFFKKRKTQELTLGILGEVNAGKTTLANLISIEFTGQEIGKASPIPHETREVKELQNIKFKTGKNELRLNLVDTPGIASSIDYRDFLEHGMTRKEAMSRAKEATQGVIKAIQSLDNINAAIVVVDSSKQPFNQINWTVVGNLEAKKIPIIVAANKNDLPEADPDLVSEIFQKDVIPISALHGTGINNLYAEIGKI